MTALGQWRATKTPYLLPVRVVKALYRGKCLGLLQEAVTQGAHSVLAPDSRPRTCPGYSVSSAHASGTCG